MIGIVLGAFFSGLAGSPHCAGMCGPFALACSTRRPGVLGWHLGRGLTYVALGGLAGALGAFVPGPHWLPTLLSVALIVWFAGALAGVLPEPRFHPPGFGRLHRIDQDRRWLPRVLLGLSTALLPCGLVYAALGLAVATTSPAAGALVMGAFWAGTLPALTALVFASRRVGLRTLRARRVVALVVLSTGLLSVALRERWLSHPVSMTGTATHVPGAAH